MGWANKLIGWATGNGAEVDANHYQLTRGPMVGQRLGGETPQPESVGGVRMFFEKDPGSITGASYLASVQVSEDESLAIGLSTPLFDYSFNGTAQDTGVWSYVFNTMTITQGGGFLLLNANSTSTTATGCYMQSKRHFQLTGNGGLHLEAVGQITGAPQAGEVFLAGLGIPAAANAAPADGVWFQLTSAGLIGTLSYNGTIVQTGVLLLASAITVNANAKYTLIVNDRVVEFWVSGSFLGEIGVPAGNGMPFLTDALPQFLQYYNSGTVSGTNMQVKVAGCHADQIDSDLGKPYPHIQASKGLSRQGMQGGTMGALSFFTNSTNPTTAAPSNTSLVANLPNLPQGGMGLATLWNLASTDMILHSAQNPVGSVNQTPRTMYITGCRISAIAFTAAWTAPAAGGHAIAFSIAHNHTAASLATAETASFANNSTKSPRRTFLGIMTWATGAAVIGTPSDRGDIQITFLTPIVVHPGEFIATVARMLNGAATATGGLLYTIDYDHYFE